MNYTLEVPEHLDKEFRALSKRDKDTLEVIHKKIKQILENPTHFKPLRGDMKGARRVHIRGSFVLTYEIEGNTVRLLDYDHHDTVY